MREYMRDFMARAVCIAKKDARIYYFKPQIFEFSILIPAFVYLSFALGREIPPDLLVPGLVGMISLFGASSIEAIAIPIERQTETYELLQTAPISTATIIFGKSLAGTAFGVAIQIRNHGWRRTLDDISRFNSMKLLRKKHPLRLRVESA